MTQVDLIRHGEPVGGRRYRGQIDDPLSDRGWQQMRTALAGHCPWQAIVTSPLRRCSEFAHQFGEQHHLPVVNEPRFKEIGFGVWEGRSAADLQQAEPGCLQKFYRNPVRYRPRGAEELDQFVRRVISAWQEILQRFAGRHILVVAHAGVMRAVTAHVLGMPFAHMFRLQVNNAAVSRIYLDDERPATLVMHNGRLA